MKILGRINLSLTFIVAMLGLFFITSPAAAQDCEFDNWDVNDDSFLDDNEFDTAYDEVGYYKEWDTDDNDSLSEMEWQKGIDEHMSAYDGGRYSDWDTNGDGNISKNEFQDGLFDLIDDNNDGQIGDDDWELFTDEDDGLFC